MGAAEYNACGAANIMAEVSNPQQIQSAQPIPAKPGVKVSNELPYPYGPQAARLPKADWEPLAMPGPPPFVLESAAVIACFCFNGLIPPVVTAIRPEPDALIAMAVGVFATQMSVLCTVLVFGDGRLWLRLAGVWAIGYGLAVTFLGSLFLSERGISQKAEAFRALICSLPLVALAVQIPLWAVYYYFGWRIGRPGEVKPSRPLSIGDIFLGTAIAAATLGAVRFAPDQRTAADPGFWLAWTIAVPSLAGVSLISVLPALYLTLRIAQPAIGCVTLFIYALVAAAVTLFAIHSISAMTRSGPPPAEMTVVFPVMFSSFAVTLFGAFSLARWRGLRLIFPSD
jgi:hypothetical protein